MSDGRDVKPQPAGLVVVLSADPALTESLPEALAALEPTTETQVVRELTSLTRHLQEVQPDVIIIDAAIALAPTLTDLLESGLLGCVPAVVADRASTPERCHAFLAAGAVAYLGSRESAPDNVALAALRAFRASGLSVRAEQTARHYQDIIEASSDGIFVLVDGAFHFVNGAIAELLGRAPGDIVGKRSLVDFVSPGQRQRTAEDLSRVAMGGGVRELLEITVVDDHGCPTHLEIACRSSVVDGQRALVGVARDVTATRELQLEIERSRKRAAQVERLRALGELAAGVAHDFNNTVATIMGRVDTARHKLSRAEAVDGDLEIIAAAARDAAAVIKRIQEFGKPAGTDTWQDVDLAAIIREAANLVSTSVPEGVRLIVDAQPVPIIQGNGVELREVVLNLLRNAVDAVEGSGTVAIRCFAHQGKAVLIVEDDGHGMPAHVQQRIFEPFFTTKGERGTGLGLSVSHWILRRHDAQIHLQSEPGQGTTFRLTFAPFTPPARRSSPMPPEALTILVVDDDPTVGDMMRDLLEEQGHHVEVVNHPSAAAQMLGERPADLMITDLDLPGMSGWQLAKKVREIQPRIIVGLITGWALGATEQELRSRGVDFVLAKPFTADALAQAIAGTRKLSPR